MIWTQRVGPSRTNPPTGLHSDKHTQLLYSVVQRQRTTTAHQLKPFPSLSSVFPQCDINKVQDWNRTSRLSSGGSRRDGEWLFTAVFTDCFLPLSAVTVTRYSGFMGPAVMWWVTSWRLVAFLFWLSSEAKLNHGRLQSIEACCH